MKTRLVRTAILQATGLGCLCILSQPDSSDHSSKQKQEPSAHQSVSFSQAPAGCIGHLGEFVMTSKDKAMTAKTSSIEKQIEAPEQDILKSIVRRLK